ncbi:MAG: TolC family outer membrane protein [Desulfobulbaceae bacterium]|jgi:adhesin transport system outer membrane protein|nr:TolC family outer membrane protein [Desulfobulbaceae bacterium]MDY0352167.1 TolC family outer membrane protein [Desulfobulbaceae bacterium]
MAKRAWSLCLAGTVFFFFFSAGASPAETLQEAVQYLIETNPEIRTVVYNRLARDQQVTQARAGYFPELGLMGGAGFQEVDKPLDQSLDPWEFALSLRQNVFRGWQDMNEVQRQEARVRSQAYVIRSASENTALQTARVYLEVLRKQAFVGLAKENLQVHQRIYDQIRLRSESGIDRRADMNQVESRLALAESNLIVNETNLLDAQTNYLGVVGHLPDGLAMPEPPDAFMPASLEDAQELALQGHPTLQQAEEDLVARKHQDDVARAPFMPIVDLELDKYWSEDVEYGLNTDEENLIGMVRVRWNLFKGWKDQARKAETSYLISEAREIRNNTHRQVVESVRLSWMAYQAAVNRMSFLQKRVESSDATALAYSRQWDIGKRTLLDVLDAEAERIDARRQLIDARFDGFIAQYRIMNGMGKMVHCLDLDWPEEAYFDGEAGTTERVKENS